MNSVGQLAWVWFGFPLRILIKEDHYQDNKPLIVVENNEDNRYNIM